jgi:rhamnopyranosyl-N-acetylglucosaminyl-diphospho-decaprenol beta-1,3/1,4-galactofuranosyltransferase
MNQISDLSALGLSISNLNNLIESYRNLGFNFNDEKLDFLNSLVIDKDEINNLSFGLFDLKKSKLLKTHVEALSHADKGLIWNTVNPFNGTLISKKLIREIGYPIKEMFIWGDEVEYMSRALKYGLGVATAVDAIHYHPKGRVESVQILGGRYRLNYQKSDLKNYCDIRNRAYIQLRYGQINNLLKYFR